MKFNPNFYTNPQNTNFNPYQTQEYGQGNTNPYMQGMDNNTTPMPLPGSTNEQALYPLESSTAYPQFNTPQAQANQPIATYKTGGRIKRKKDKSLKSLMQAAHINPETGLREYKGGGLFRTLAPIVGSLLGNAIMPGIGGSLLGGALSSFGASHLTGDKKNALRNALIGGASGAAGSYFGVPGFGQAGMPATKVAAESAKTVGKNTLLPTVISMAPGSMSKNTAHKTAAYTPKTPHKRMGLGVSAGDEMSGTTSMDLPTLKEAAEKKYYSDMFKPAPTFKEKLKDTLTDPASLVSLGSLGLNAYNSLKKQPKEKEKNPEQLASEKKRYAAASRLTPEEIQERQNYFNQIDAAHNNSNTTMRLPATLNRRQHSPDEFAKSGRWFSYYDNPETYKDGGEVNSLAMAMKPKLMLEEIDIRSPRGGMYLHGNTGGQDDKIPANLSDGEYVIDASTVSDLGDGNNNAGARILERLQKNVRKHKRGGKIGLPPKAKNLKDYMR